MRTIMNIWKEKNIPVLERCSLDRAAEILGCNSEDLLLLAEDKKITVQRRVFREKAIGTIYTANSRLIEELTGDNKARRRIIDFMPSGLEMVGDIIKITEYKNNKLIEIELIAYGLWTISMNSVANYTMGGHVLSAFSEDLTSRIGIKTDRKILETKDIFINRHDIERLYASKVSGNTITEEIEYGEINYPDEESGKERITAKQSDMIAYLMNVAGITKKQMLNESITSIMNKISKKNSELDMPNITDESVAAWLKRAKVRG